MCTVRCPLVIYLSVYVMSMDKQEKYCGNAKRCTQTIPSNNTLSKLFKFLAYLTENSNGDFVLVELINIDEYFEIKKYLK